MTGIPLAPIGVLLFVACLIAMVSRRIGLPYSVGLVAAGVAIAFVPNTPTLPLSRNLIFNIFLPPLVFEAALQLPWRSFRREVPVVLTLAFVGVALAATVVAAGMHFALGWTWLGAALFGVLIAATDPVAVIAAFKEMKAEKRLSMLVESESLLNDGVVAVAFAVLVGIAGGASTGAASVVPSFLWTLFGGALVGGALSGLILLVAGRTKDHLVEITLTTLAAYGSFLVAERVGASGVLASLTAGLMIGNLGRLGPISNEGWPHVLSAWEFFAFLANSFVFLMIGMQEAAVPINRVGYLTAASAILLVLLGRAAAIYPLALLFRRTKLKVTLPYQHILFWGGLRGALALALALTVPASVPERVPIIITAFVVVAFSIFVQGLTMPWLVSHFGLTEHQHAK
ncbi:MAG TPA: sodium:proton antiporter [Sphingomicrobium sp.]|jgi:CPA1 family monovalent cation:H+ antiporter|nr:sodium:proton antiporter [Sphingomicrobium sp.]